MRTSSLLRTLSLLALCGTLFTAAACADTAAPWKLKDLDGKTVSLSDFKGKVVVLDFWATWCPPCRMEIPHFIALQKQYASQGMSVVGISLDESPDAVVAFAKKEGINYPIVMGDEKVVADYGNIEAIPTTFIIDQNGKIVNKYVGYTEPDVIENDVKKLLNANSASNTRPAIPSSAAFLAASAR